MSDSASGEAVRDRRGHSVEKFAGGPPNLSPDLASGVTISFEAFATSKLSEVFTRLHGRRKAFGGGTRRKLEAFAVDQSVKIEALHCEIATNSYVPCYRGCLITQHKDDGSVKKRGITLMSVNDYLVQKILLDELYKLSGSAFLSRISYGVRDPAGPARTPYLCCSAIAEARRLHPFAFRTDLKDFFPSVDRKDLWEKLEEVLPANWPYASLLHSTIYAEVSPDNSATPEERNRFWPAGRGVPQGTVLAPFFANVVMSSWDHRWESDLPLFRYVDDWIVLGDSQEELMRTAQMLIKSLPRGVDCHGPESPKSTRSSPEEPIHFVGLTVTHNSKVGPSEEVVRSFFQKVERITADANDAIVMLKRLSSYYRGWTAYYERAGLRNDLKNRVRKHLKDSLAASISSRLGIPRDAAGQLVKWILTSSDFRNTVMGEEAEMIQESLLDGKHHEDVERMICDVTAG